MDQKGEEEGQKVRVGQREEEREGEIGREKEQKEREE